MDSEEEVEFENQDLGISNKPNVTVLDDDDAKLVCFVLLEDKKMLNGYLSLRLSDNDDALLAEIRNLPIYHDLNKTE